MTTTDRDHHISFVQKILCSSNYLLYYDKAEEICTNSGNTSSMKIQDVESH
jgi:hypothetical protein